MRVKVFIPEQVYEFNLEDLCIDPNDRDSILEYIVYPAVNDAESEWEVIE